MTRRRRERSCGGGWGLGSEICVRDRSDAAVVTPRSGGRSVVAELKSGPIPSDSLAALPRPSHTQARGHGHPTPSIDFCAPAASDQGAPWHRSEVAAPPGSRASKNRRNAVIRSARYRARKSRRRCRASSIMLRFAGTGLLPSTPVQCRFVLQPVPGALPILLQRQFDLACIFQRQQILPTDLPKNIRQCPIILMPQPILDRDDPRPGDAGMTALRRIRQGGDLPPR